MRTKFKPWAKPFIEEHNDKTISLEEFALLEYPIYLEIGCGKGQFIVDMAKKNKDISFIGVERNVTCCGFTLKKIVDEEINNAKLFVGDGEKVVEVIKDNSVKYLFLNFSDPWPKKRHNKRRLTHDNFLKQYKRIISDDGYIIFKTDNVELFEFSLDKFIESGLEIVSLTRDYQQLDEFDTMTEYETNFRNKGVKINRLIAKRK